MNIVTFSFFAYTIGVIAAHVHIFTLSMWVVCYPIYPLLNQEPPESLIPPEYDFKTLNAS